MRDEGAHRSQRLGKAKERQHGRRGGQGKCGGRAKKRAAVRGETRAAVQEGGVEGKSATMLRKVSDETFARAAEARGYEQDHQFLLGLPEKIFEAEAMRRGFKRKHE